MSPKHLHWSFGKSEMASPAEALSAEIALSLELPQERKEFSFKDEIRLAVEELKRKSAGRTIALCHGGGVHSELLARLFSAQNLPFEFYFMNNWGLNEDNYENQVLPLAESLNKPLHRITLDRMGYYEQAKKTFLEFGCESPTHLGLTCLFERIPSRQFIVLGDGSFDRTGSLFSFIGDEHPQESGTQDLQILFSLNHIFYYLWAAKRHREGEFYFFQSTPGLIAATLSHPRFSANYPFSESRNVLYSEFPDLIPQEKNSNWPDRSSVAEYFELRSDLKALASHTPGFEFWKKCIGTPVKVYW